MRVVSVRHVCVEEEGWVSGCVGAWERGSVTTAILVHACIRRWGGGAAFCAGCGLPLELLSPTVFLIRPCFAGVHRGG